MLFIDTCVLLAVLMPEVHSAAAVVFPEEASGPLAISSSSVTELHSLLGLKVFTKPGEAHWSDPWRAPQTLSSEA